MATKAKGKARAKTRKAAAKAAGKGKAAKAGPVIKLVAGATPSFRQGSARALYYARLQQYNGKPLAAFVASCAANPPSTPARGKLAGKQEPVQGWVSYFTRNGYCTVA